MLRPEVLPKFLFNSSKWWKEANGRFSNNLFRYRYAKHNLKIDHEFSCYINVGLNSFNNCCCYVYYLLPKSLKETTLTPGVWHSVSKRVLERVDSVKLLTKSRKGNFWLASLFNVPFHNRVIFKLFTSAEHRRHVWKLFMMLINWCQFYCPKYLNNTLWYVSKNIAMLFYASIFPYVSLFIGKDRFIDIIDLVNK